MTATRLWRIWPQHIRPKLHSRIDLHAEITIFKPQCPITYTSTNFQNRNLSYSCRLQSISTAESTPRQPPKPKALERFTLQRLRKEFQLDENIGARWVQVKDEDTGKLNPAQTLNSILSTIDRDKQTIRCLGNPPDGPPVVEVTTWDALRERLHFQLEAQAAGVKAHRESKPKQIELNWAISGHDLDMKMRQLREFVEKGKRVEILLAAKRRQRKASPEEARNVVHQVRKTISEIERCKEIKEMEGNIGGQALMVVQKLKS